MGEQQIDVIEAEEFKVPEVKTGLQAMTLVWQGMSYFFTNHKKATWFVLILVSLLVWQSVTNFEALKSAAESIGGL
jgi:hypothetical protein